MDLYNYTFEESSEDFYLDRKGEIKSIFQFPRYRNDA